jgi:ribosomal protein S18 acetylase RimI-like enzyme
MNNLIIRRVKLEDQASLEKLYLDSRILTFDWVDPAIFKLSDFSQDTTEEEIWVAELSGKIIGFVSVWAQDSFIHHLYVDQMYHNKGVGSALLDEVYRNFTSTLKLKCLSQNQKAIKFYEKKGWINSGVTKRSDVYGDYITYIFNPLN